MIAVYVRVSTREQTQGYGLESQIHQIKSYLSSEGVSDDKIKLYQDAGQSGSLFERPALQKLIADIKNNIISDVVCYKLDRLARGLNIQQKIFNIFEKYQVNFFCTHEEVGRNTASERFSINIKGSVAEWERDTIIERTLDGMRQSAREGNFSIGLLPLAIKK